MTGAPIETNAGIAGGVALVTGAARGLGACLVDALIDAGARRVYALSRRPATTGRTTDDRIIPLVVDVSDEAAVRAAARLAHDVTIVVNNAGVLDSGALLEAPSLSLQRSFETNVFGMVNVCCAFAHTLGRTQGRLVNILSVSSLAASADVAAYSASKAAAHSITQSLRCLLKANGVRVHAVYPGPLDTGMASGLVEKRASPRKVAIEIVDAVSAEIEDIFPDDMSRQARNVWSDGPKKLERLFADLTASPHRQERLQ